MPAYLVWQLSREWVQQALWIRGRKQYDCMAEKNGQYRFNTILPGPDHSAGLPGHIVCEPLTRTDVETVARLYTDIFLTDEPATRRYAPDPAFFLHHARFYVRYLVKSHLSFIARDRRTGEIPGFIFCIDLTDDPAGDGPEMTEFVNHFRELVALIDELEDRHIDRNRIAPGSVLHVYQIGVHRHYRGAGIAGMMIRQVLTHAKERGFRQVIADCTGPVSHSAFGQCGFYKAGSISYDAFSINGSHFFSGLEGGISLMVRNR
jgi:ribosomal protein S18 acetylase RimI-like enzyme